MLDRAAAAAQATEDEHAAAIARMRKTELVAMLIHASSLPPSPTSSCPAQLDRWLTHTAVVRLTRAARERRGYELSSLLRVATVCAASNAATVRA